MVSIGPEGHHDHPTGDPCSLASSRLPPVLALEISLSWRPIEDRRGPARVDPADERGKSVVGAPRIHGELLKLGFEVAQSSVAKYMVKRCAPRPRDGGPSCVTTRRTSPPWTCSLFRPLASTCSMPLSSFGWPAETSSGSMSQPIRPRTGSHARSP